MNGIVLYPEPVRRRLGRLFDRRLDLLFCRLGWHDWTALALWVGPVGHVNVLQCGCGTARPKDVAHLKDLQAMCERRRVEENIYR